MRRLLHTATICLGSLVIAIGSAAMALWWTSREQGTPWPPEWIRKAIPGFVRSDGVVEGITDEVGAAPGPALQPEPPGEPRAVKTVVSLSSGTGWWGSDPSGEEDAPAPPEIERHAWAYIVGIDEYIDPRSTDLSFAVNDAREVCEVLIRDFGYAPERVRYLASPRPDRPSSPSPEGVSEVHPATLATLREDLTGEEGWLAKQDIQPQDSFLLFFAGHGDRERRTHDGYLAASDSDPNDKDTCIRLKNLTEHLDNPKHLPCLHKALILDACYAGNLFREPESLEQDDLFQAGQLLPRAGNDDLDYYLSQPAFLGLTAGRETPVADGGGDNEHSVFTYHLLDVLRKRADSARYDHRFTFREMAMMAEREVRQDFQGTKREEGIGQIPRFGYLGKGGDGDLVFSEPVDPEDLTEIERERRLAEEGRKWLENGEDDDPANDVPIYPHVQIFAAKALGFAGYGRLSANHPDYRRFALENPVCFDPRFERHRRDLGRAKRLIEQGGLGRCSKFLWSSSDHGSPVNHVAWSPDGARLASASSDNTVRIWEAGGGPARAVLEGHGPSVAHVAWSPDGAHLASASSDNTVRIWGERNWARPEGFDLYRYFQENWVRFDDANEDLEWLVGEDEALGFRDDLLNPGSISFLLRDADRRQKELCGFHLERRLWKQAWLWWERLSGEEREQLASRIFVSFYHHARRPPTDAPPGWYETRLQGIWTAHREAGLEALEQTVSWYQLEQFVEGIASREAACGLEEVSLASLGILREKARTAPREPETTAQWDQWEEILERRVPAGRLGNAQTFKEILALLEEAEQQGQKASGVFAEAGASSLEKAVELAVQSDDPGSAAIALEASAALLKLVPEGWKGAFLHGRALAKGGRIPDAVSMYRQALRHAAHETQRQTIFESLDEAVRGASDEVRASIPREVLQSAVTRSLMAAPDFASLNASLEEARRWGLNAAEIYSSPGLGPAGLTAIVKIASESEEDRDREEAEAIVAEVLPHLEAALPRAEGETRAEALRAIAGNHPDTAVAFRTWRKLLETEFTEAEDFWTAGGLAAELGDGAACRDIFAAGLARHDEASGLLNYLFGESLRTLDADEEALPCYRAARDNPAGLQESYAYHGLADLLGDLERDDEARAVWQELAAEDEALPEHLADAFYFASQPEHPHPEECRTIYETALGKADSAGDRGYVHHMFGWAQVNLQAHAGAYQSFQRAHAIAGESDDDEVEVHALLHASLAASAALAGLPDEVVAAHYQDLVAAQGEEESYDDETWLDAMIEEDDGTEGAAAGLKKAWRIWNRSR